MPKRRDAVLRGTLANDVAVLLCPRPTLAQAYAAVFFGVGSRHETVPLNGITHMLEHMLFRGTKSFKDATALNAAAENIGGYLEGATYRDHLMFATGCHPSELPAAIAILGELVLTPRYGSLEVERSILREEILEGLDARGRSVDIDNISHACLFEEHPLGMPIEGTLETLERIGVADLEAHRQRYLVGKNAVVCLAGPMNGSKMLTHVERAFAAMPRGEATVALQPPPPAAAPQFTFVRDTASQVDLRISFRGLPAHDPDYAALVTLARLLADGLASRMHAELIDEKGLAYALHAGPTIYTDCGLFEFDVAVAPAKAAEALHAILGFARAARRSRFNAPELERVRRRYRYNLEFMRDSAPDLVGWHGRAALFGVEKETAALAKQMDGIDAAAVRAVARRVFQSQGLVVVAVGELTRTEVRELRTIVENAEV